MADKVEIEIVLKSAQETLSLLKKIQDDVGNVGTEATITESKAKSFASSIKSNFLAITAGVVAALATIKKAFDFSREAAEFGEQTDIMRDKFGVNFQKMLDAVQNTTDGTVGNAEIIKSSLRAMSLGVTTDIDTMAKLFAIARQKGDELGIGTVEAFDSMSLAIAKGSAMAFEKLGIQSDAWENEAKSVGKVFDNHFVLNKLLDESNSILTNSSSNALSAAARYVQLTASLSNLKIMIGQYLTPAFETIIPFINAISEKLSEWTKKTKESNVMMSYQFDSLKDYKQALNAVNDAFRGSAKGKIETEEQIQKRIKAYTREWYEDQLKAIEQAKNRFIQAEKEKTAAKLASDAAQVTTAKAQAKSLEKIETENEDAYKVLLKKRETSLEETLNYNVGITKEANAETIASYDGLANVFNSIGGDGGSIAAQIIQLKKLSVETDSNATKADRLAQSWSSVAGVIGIVRSVMQALSTAFADNGKALEEHSKSEGWRNFGVFLQDTSKLIDALVSGGIPGLIRAILDLRDTLNNKDLVDSGQVDKNGKPIMETEAARRGQKGSQAEKRHASATTGAIVGGLLGGGIGATVGMVIGKNRQRADGGPVMANTPYMVGERGPELRVFDKPGTIIPNNKLGGETFQFNNVKIVANNPKEFFDGIQNYRRQYGSI